MARYRNKAEYIESVEAEAQLIIDYFDHTPRRFLGIGVGNIYDHLFPLLSGNWTGIYCEPNPMDCAKIITDCEKFCVNGVSIENRVTILNTGVMASSGLKTMYVVINNTCTSSFDPVFVLENPGNKSSPIVRKIIVNTIGANELIDYVGTDIDLINIDAEMSDSEIVIHLPWKKLNRCRMVIVEEINNAAKKILADNNFVIHTKTFDKIKSNNTVYIKELT